MSINPHYENWAKNWVENQSAYLTKLKKKKSKPGARYL
jgi:hypothetical protein